MRNRPYVITLTSVARGGKDTVADMIIDYCKEHDKKVLSIAYADYLKAICKRNFGYDENDKEAGRHILQHFGTEVVKSKEKEFWARVVFHTFDLLCDDYDVFLVPDARFEEELQLSPYNLFYPIINVFVHRTVDSPLGEAEKHHASEQMASDPDWSKFHAVVDNNGTLEETNAQVDELMENIFSRVFEEELEGDIDEQE